MFERLSGKPPQPKLSDFAISSMKNWQELAKIGKNSRIQFWKVKSCQGDPLSQTCQGELNPVRETPSAKAIRIRYF